MDASFIHIHGLQLLVVHVEHVGDLLKTKELVADAPWRMIGHEAQDATQILVKAKRSQFRECESGNCSLPLLHQHVKGDIEQQRVVALSERFLHVSAPYVHGIHESRAQKPRSRDAQSPLVR